MLSFYSPEQDVHACTYTTVFTFILAPNHQIWSLLGAEKEYSVQMLNETFLNSCPIENRVMQLLWL